MNEIELKKLHDKIQSVKDFGDFNKFKNKMGDVNSRKRFYDKYFLFLKSKGVNLGSYDEYERRLSSNVETDGGGGHTGGGSVSQGWLSDPTGNKTWEYQLRDCKWVARKIGETKEYNISDNPKYISSVQKLNDANPNLIKDCNKTKPEEVKPVINQINLPDWATCIKVVPNLKLSQDSKGTSIIQMVFGDSGDYGYFWEGGTFLYVFKDENKGKIYGKWSCKDNSLVVTTDDGQVWMSGSGWVVSPDKVGTPDTNTGTNWMTPDELSGDETSQPVKTESTMDNLENIINEVNDLIIEQTQQVVQAPADELNSLENNPILKSKGTLETLCRTANQTSKPIKVNNGKTYFAGKAVTRKDNTVVYITYDGMVIKRVSDNSCVFEYVKGDDKNNIHIKGIPFSDLSMPYLDVLSRFGINPLNYDSDPLYLIKKMTIKLQNLITNQGARSAVFKNWNDVLTYWDPKGVRLTGTEDNFANPMPDELNQYTPATADSLGLTYLDKQIKIYLKRGGRHTNDFTDTTYDFNKCRQDLVTYLKAAFDFEKEGTIDDTVNSNSVRKSLQGCYTSGAFQKMTPIKDTDLNLQLNDKNNPFKGLRGFGNDLDINDVKKLLSGNHFKLPKVGPSGNNPYLPFNLDTRNMNESKLNTLIKENLQKLSEQKNSNLLAETRIIQTRTKILTENRILKFKQPREKFFNEIISEAIYLESQGFDKQLIKEEFWDTLKGMFGQHGSEAIFGTFKEYMGKWLLQKLTPVNPNGWIGSIVVAAIGNLHIDDLSKLTDCNFLVKKLSSSIGEGIARKIQHDKGYDGGISDIVRNGLFSAIDNNEMVKSLENGLAKLICPALSGVKTKLEDKAQQMKTMAVQA
jgi:hypothetical protein